MLLAISSKAIAGITAEQVLGEYWKDPLFGQASSDESISIEILNGVVWPSELKVNKGQTLRILFINKTDKMHLFAISENVELLMTDNKFNSFVKDEVYHAKLSPITDGQHTHANTELDAAKSIVMTLDENPTVLVPGNDKKEILIRLDKPSIVTFQCVLDDHDIVKEKGVIYIE